MTEPKTTSTVEEAKILASKLTPKRTAAKAKSVALAKSDIPNPAAGQSAMWGPTAFASSPVGDITHTYDTQEFTVDEDKVAYLYFTPPGLPLPKKKLYCVKAFKPDGTFVQLPFEEQIQNTAGSGRDDAIGLRRYQNKGFVILFDFAELRPVYCAAWDCFAQAQPDRDFCSPAHGAATLPNQSESGGVREALFTSGATTSRVWGG